MDRVLSHFKSRRSSERTWRNKNGSKCRNFASAAWQLSTKNAFYLLHVPLVRIIISNATARTSFLLVTRATFNLPQSFETASRQFATLLNGTYYAYANANHVYVISEARGRARGDRDNEPPTRRIYRGKLRKKSTSDLRWWKVTPLGIDSARLTHFTLYISTGTANLYVAGRDEIHFTFLFSRSNRAVANLAANSAASSRYTVMVIPYRQ